MSCCPLKSCWIIAGHELEVSQCQAGVGCKHLTLLCTREKDVEETEEGLCQNHVSNFWPSSGKAGGRLAECSGNDQRQRNHDTHGKIGRIRIVLRRKKK